jgi:transcriptional regulator with XRE-family HTH domain
MDATKRNGNTVTRHKLRKLFKRHHGSIKRVAGQLGVSCEAVSRWLQGKNDSVRVEAAVLREAEKLFLEDAEIETVRAKLSRIGSCETAA